MNPMIIALVEARITALRGQATEFEQQRLAAIATVDYAEQRRDESNAEADALEAALTVAVA